MISSADRKYYEMLVLSLDLLVVAPTGGRLGAMSGAMPIHKMPRRKAIGK